MSDKINWEIYEQEGYGCWKDDYDPRTIVAEAVGMCGCGGGNDDISNY